LSVIFSKLFFLAEASGNEKEVEPRYYIQNDLFRYLEYQEKEEGVEEKGYKIRRKYENQESQPVSNKPDHSQSQYQRSKAPDVRKPQQPIEVTQPSALSWADRTKKLDDYGPSVSTSHPVTSPRASSSSGPAGGGYDDERDLSSSLFISNIPYTLTPPQVINAFTSAVKGISIKNLTLKENKGFGFVFFSQS